MPTNKWIQTFFAIGFGLYLIYKGLTAEYLIDESEGNATEEEKERWKATPITRTLVVSVGSISILYGLYHSMS